MYEDETAFMSCEDRNYYRDRRVTAEYIAPPANGKFTWAICPLCDGHGKVIDPNIDASGLSAEDFRDDPDFAEDYCSGTYDIECRQCRGRGSVVVLPDGAAPEDEDEGPDGCTDPRGHSFVCSGTAYGGDDESYMGEGRCYCEHCGADGDA